MTPAELRAEMTANVSEWHDICARLEPALRASYKATESTDPDPGAREFLGRLDQTAARLAALPDAELVSTYETFVRDRAVVSWLADETELARPGPRVPSRLPHVRDGD